ncbi:spore protease YyaC [Siminovitchia sp. FSL H7-0308]|uniref:Sporulation protein YyaC n=1 Tax=Siminovitchia thermophila TaxID=1245522 RepID=A0ABS2RAY5_9BACI|nr:spore protease YyaC [Siminovitchia thermophila]MBM7716815.1 putative sporulation protein YyaC [Siminovitchia thermophila]ONK22978.1 spore protease YyaC [Bacillus sp. VT-16-64]
MGNELIVHYEDPMASHKICETILGLFPRSVDRPIVVVCIGTDRSTGDSLGPLIGSFLQENGLNVFHVFGTLDDPVHAMNLENILKYIKAHYRNPFMIGIDACLGRIASIGDIKVNAGPVKPGAGVHKKLPEVGHASITGIVNVAGHMEFVVLQNTRLSLVMKLAKQISAGILEADRICFQKSMFQRMRFHMTDKRSAK